MGRKSRQKREKNISSFSLMEKIRQKLRTDVACTEEQIIHLENIFRGILPSDEDHEYAEYAIQVDQGKVVDPPRTLKVNLDMEDGTMQRIVLRNSYELLMSRYLIKKYNHELGALYWYALVSEPQEFYEHLIFLKKEVERERHD